MGRDSVARPALNPATAEPIDAVYLWVNGNDPAYQALVREYQAREVTPPSPDSVAACRFSDHGELRYSLRSLETYAPWIRHVYVVTNGQVPEWLDRSNPRISVVPHAAIFPDSADLPTFNSNAIALHLHRIANLSRRFLCLDDDYFVGHEVSPADFLGGDGRQRVFLDVHTLPNRLDEGPVLHRACAYTQALLDRQFGAKARRRAVSHVPQLVDRDIITELGTVWPDEEKRTSSHRFRSPTDAVPAILYVYYLLEAPRERADRGPLLRPDVRRGGFLMRLTGDLAQARLDFKYVATYRPKFFAVNDDLDDASAHQMLIMEYKAFLAWYFPRPSSFERSRP